MPLYDSHIFFRPSHILLLCSSERSRPCNIFFSMTNSLRLLIFFKNLDMLGENEILNFRKLNRMKWFQFNSIIYSWSFSFLHAFSDNPDIKHFNQWIQFFIRRILQGCAEENVARTKNCCGWPYGPHSTSDVRYQILNVQIPRF